VSEWSGLTSFVSSLELCTTVVVKSAVTGADSSRVFTMPAHRSTMPQINMSYVVYGRVAFSNYSRGFQTNIFPICHDLHV